MLHYSAQCYEVEIQIWRSTQILLSLNFRNNILVSKVNSRTTLKKSPNLRLTHAGRTRINLHAIILINVYIFFSVALRPTAGQGLLFLEVSRSHTTTQHSRYFSPGRVISSSQRPQPDNTHTHTTDKHPCPRQDSNVQSE